MAAAILPVSGNLVYLYIYLQKTVRLVVIPITLLIFFISTNNVQRYKKNVTSFVAFFTVYNMSALPPHDSKTAH